MKEKDAKALLGLLGECCCCCDDEQTTAVQTPLLPIVTRPAGENGKPGGGLSRMPTRRGVTPDEPFIPSAPSFDTPQRPGWHHLPGVLDGVFVEAGDETVSADLTTRVVLDDGTAYSFAGSITHPVIDHVQRAIRGWGSYEDEYQHAFSDGTWVPSPTPLSEGPYTEIPQLRWHRVMESELGGTHTLTYYRHTLRYDGNGEIMKSDEDSESTPMALDFFTATWSGTPATSYRLTEIWKMGVFDNEVRYQQVAALEGDFGEDIGWQRIAANDRILPAREWARRGVTIPEGLGPRVTLSDRVMVQGVPIRELTGPPAPEIRFLAPATGEQGVMTDAVVRSTSTTAKLGDGQVTAFGRVLEGGSWAALRGPGGETWVLHENGPTVTRVDIQNAQSISREQFEQEVLRVPAGTFERFDEFGLTYNTWPHQWALARCSGEFRAVTAHDPWRDSVQGQRPVDSLDPDGWYWPGRPGKRPKPMLASAPRAVLGLTLADVMRGITSDDDGGGSG